jgi:hypothetical protein
MVQVLLKDRTFSMTSLVRAVAVILALLVAFSSGWFWNEYEHANLIASLRADNTALIGVSRENAEMAEKSLTLSRQYRATTDRCLSRSELPLPPRHR